MQKQFTFIVAVALGVIACCNFVSAQELVTVRRRLMVKVPLPLVLNAKGNGVIFPVQFGDIFLSQCSRTTLGKGDSYWLPFESDIGAYEKVALDYMKKNRPATEMLSKWPNLKNYHRQYVGVVRGEKKTIYANFLPSGGIGEDDWRQKPLELCDGGASFFGMEIDLEASAVLHVDFDGCMCSIVPANKPLQTTRSKQRASER